MADSKHQPRIDCTEARDYRPRRRDMEEGRCLRGIQEMLEIPMAQEGVVTELLVIMIDQDKHSYGTWIRLPTELRRAVLSATRQVVVMILGMAQPPVRPGEEAASRALMECWFLFVRIFDTTTVEDVDGALDGEEVVSKVMVRAAAALWDACKLTLLQSTSSKLLNVIVQTMSQYVARMAPQARLGNFSDMKEAVISKEKRLLSHCSDVFSLPTVYTLLAVITKRFDIAMGSSLDGPRNTLQGINAWTQHAAMHIEFHSPPSAGKDSAYHRAVAVLALGLMAIGVIPVSALAPADMTPLQSQWAGTNLQSRPPPDMTQAEWEAMRLPPGAWRPGLAIPALELAANMNTVEIRPAVEMAMEIILPPIPFQG